MKQELVLTRVFDAPRELVFEAWTEPGHLSRWWGPKGFTNSVFEMDVRPGGAYRIVMLSPEGIEHRVRGIYHEVVKPVRLVFESALEDVNGHSITEGWTTVTFSEQEGKTKLTLQTRSTALAAYAARLIEGMDSGWTQSLERLEQLLADARISKGETT